MSGYDIPLSEEVAVRLADLPLFRQRIVIESAVNKALDAAGWPRTESDAGTVDMTSYWYVVLSRDGTLVGHVGPITNEQAAIRVADSWKRAWFRARISRAPVGRALTNAHG